MAEPAPQTDPLAQTDPVAEPAPVLRLRIDGPVATLTLNRPEVMNALNARLFDELEAAVATLAGNEAVRVMILTGAGERAFAAGADLRELRATDAASGERLARRGQAVFDAIERCPKPVLAAINGVALGGGCELALACTLRLAADTARLGQPEIKLGLLPGYGGTQRLPRLIGSSQALRLLLTGEAVSAAEALRLGLVDEVVDAAGLDTRARALADELAQAPPLAVRACLRAVREGRDLPLADALQLEARLFGELSGTHDKHEGVRAFLEKRKPVFRGH